MTQRGLLTAITRHGINRVELGPLRKCSFEETVEILLEAGLFSETDNLTGITENIMLGQLAPFGTGCFDLMLDTEKIINSKSSINSFFQDKLKNENNNIIQTPREDDNIIATPYHGQTPGMLGNSIYPSLTPIGRMSPSFTPPFNPMSPKYIIGHQTRDYITTPNPLVSPKMLSPNYYPGSEYTKSPYSPIVDHFESSNMGSNQIKNVNSNYTSSPNNIYSPTESVPSNYHPGQSSVYPASGNNTSSPSYSPVSTNNMGSSPRYIPGKSPGYNFPSSNNPSYSPTTPIYKSSQSPNYSSNNIYRSNYSGGSSPKGTESGSGTLQYSPRSPTYNPKSPSYNIISGGAFPNSPIYNPSSNQNINNNNNIIKKEEYDEEDDEN